MTNGQSVATWSLSGASVSDSGSRVVCQQPDSLDAPAAILVVYSKKNNTDKQRKHVSSKVQQHVAVSVTLSSAGPMARGSF